MKKFEPYINQFQFGHLNARSVPKSIDELNYIISKLKLDAFAVSESWLSEHLPNQLFEIEGYQIFRKDRLNKRAGGVCVYVKDYLNAKIIDIPHTLEQPEVIFIELSNNHTKLALGVVYKPPKIPYGTFACLQETFADILCKYENTFVFGDFNVDMLDSESCATKFLTNNIIEPFGFTQIVSEPTRVTETSSKLIDLMLVSNNNCVKMVGVSDFPGISDHSMTYMACNISKPKFKNTPVWLRDYSKFNYDRFKVDAENASWEHVYGNDNLSVDEKTTVLSDIINQLFDKHAPFKKCYFSKFGRRPTWLTDDIRVLQAKRDCAYTAWKDETSRVRKLQLHKTYKALRNLVNQRSRNSKFKVFNQEINSNIKNSKQFWKAASNFGVHNTKNKHSCTVDPTTLNTNFISNNNAPCDDQAVNSQIEDILRDGPNLPRTFVFQQVPESDIKKLVKTLKYTAGGPDQITAKMIKLVIPFSVTAITHIINCSIVNGVFPSNWKKANVIPIPKIPNPSKLSDFRPISLLCTLSKILEKVISKQILAYLEENNLLERLQSGFRKKHNTATALLKISDDIFSNIDAAEVTFLVLLDYSKAFDTVLHKLLVTKLLSLGFGDMALNWVGSYLSDRYQRVKSNGKFSDYSHIKNGVPQGSILGPLLFTVLVADFGKCLNSVDFHQYADDVQCYIGSKLNNIPQTVHKINVDMDNMSKYSTANGLRLNYDKCKFMVIGTRQKLADFNKLDIPPITIDNHVIKRESNLKNLGVIFDEHMCWVKHVNKSICRAYGALRSLYRFKHFLSEESKKSLCDSLVLSHFDYCDTILLNISNILSSKIQKVQNACVRFIYNFRKFDREHISPYLIKLNWLNMESRRNLHALTLMYKIDNNLAPNYLCELVNRNNHYHSYNTRAARDYRNTRCNLSLRQKTFFGSIPSMFNNLPLTLKGSKNIVEFKTNCKKRLFSIQCEVNSG